MDDLLQEYKHYYQVRAGRFANNPNYTHTYQAESALSNAMQSCNELIEFKDKMGDLNEKCALALVKDEHLMEKQFFDKHQETVRAKAAERILAKVDQCANVTELMTMVTEESNKNSLEISMDEWQREFQGDWKQLDDIEIFENAEVPAQYKSRMMETAREIRQRLQESVRSSEEEAQKFDPSFRFRPEMNLEHRHIRLMPYKEADIREQLSNYKTLINR